LSGQNHGPDFRGGGRFSSEGFEVELVFLDLLRQFNAADRHGRRLESLDREHRPDALLYPAVILLAIGWYLGALGTSERRVPLSRHRHRLFLNANGCAIANGTASPKRSRAANPCNISGLSFGQKSFPKKRMDRMQRPRGATTLSGKHPAHPGGVAPYTPLTHASLEPTFHGKNQRVQRDGEERAGHDQAQALFGQEPEGVPELA
jgi:hypothetical protein